MQKKRDTKMVFAILQLFRRALRCYRILFPYVPTTCGGLDAAAAALSLSAGWCGDYAFSRNKCVLMVWGRANDTKCIIRSFERGQMTN